MPDQLILRLHADDAGAFTAIFQSNYRPLCKFASRILNDNQVADDLVQESFLKFWRLRMNFHSYRQIEAFLYKSTKNAAINYVRGQNVEQKANKYFLKQTHYDDPNFLMDLYLRASFEKDLFGFIEAMPERRREVLLLLYKEGLEKKEISEILKISIFTVKEHKREGLKAIRKKFDLDTTLVLLLIFLLLANHAS